MEKHELPDSAKVAIVAALEREVRPLVKRWRIVEREYGGHRFRFFENQRAVLVCGGIGPEAARRATEAVIMLYQPSAVFSVGFAGALDSTLKGGEILVPRRVIDAHDSSSVDTGTGNGVLVSFPALASTDQKAKLAKAYGAQAVDMEAAAVARGAATHSTPFAAVKAISDNRDFDLPPLERFIGADGVFREAAFTWFAVVRPWLWPALMGLARDSSRASRALCAWLDQFNHSAQTSEARGLTEPSRER
jgi:adenosylhomocysteine nucleosidase